MKIEIKNWKAIIKAVITVATALLGLIASDEIRNDAE